MKTLEELYNWQMNFLIEHGVAFLENKDSEGKLSAGCEGKTLITREAMRAKLIASGELEMAPQEHLRELIKANPDIQVSYDWSK